MSLLEGKQMRVTNTRREYLRLWNEQHFGYKAADSRRRAIFRPASRAFYREILGVRVRVNLIPLATNGYARGSASGEIPMGLAS